MKILKFDEYINEKYGINDSDDLNSLLEGEDDDDDLSYLLEMDEEDDDEEDEDNDVNELDMEDEDGEDKVSDSDDEDGDFGQNLEVERQAKKDLNLESNIVDDLVSQMDENVSGFFYHCESLQDVKDTFVQIGMLEARVEAILGSIEDYEEGLNESENFSGFINEELIFETLNDELEYFFEEDAAAPKPASKASSAKDAANRFAQKGKTAASKLAQKGKTGFNKAKAATGAVKKGFMSRVKGIGSSIGKTLSNIKNKVTNSKIGKKIGKAYSTAKKYVQNQWKKRPGGSRGPSTDVYKRGKNIKDIRTKKAKDAKTAGAQA